MSVALKSSASLCQPQIVFQKHSGNIALYTCTNSLQDVALENLTAVPDSPLSVLLEWKVVPTDGHHCITSYDIQITGPNGSHWEEQIPGGNNSFLWSRVQLEPLKEYTYSVTAIIPSIQTGPTVKHTSLVEVQGMFDKT